MSWPAQSVDLNLIKLVWDELDWKVRVKQPTSAAHFWQLSPENWAELFSVYLQSLVERMQRICEVVIVAKVGCFDESNIKEVFLWFLVYFLFNVA